ncbi:MAG: flagellar biosynthesis anti-sigma factor FlgM [Nitrospina sp.]|jgi:flagellar biosynthesis anti-sigma factor FlgM|nr:flagellar biosynthesis anti-sigma factor FlgM [Nitrospina sp.]MBT3875913.1 flagellar biosynthesis anti-sigma factor FlgM [Nitrospina sp.]MBT4046952.1 flagellar biosynthesis anti-sigma factor FlgM [Nitrospina sp.]MBT4557328.1 flagellar biosynthesis anti-sigma factor FlgM [Nitrospina sp.]MBT5347600.1 flagellar biosynthesis anti-sigma factor FlgM [Nitrospina sp.]
MNKLEPTLKINRRDALNGSTKGSKKPIKDDSSSSKNVDRVSLSDSSKTQASASGIKTIASEIRQDLVNKFRNVLQDGSYQVKADEIADKIVQKIRENKNRLVL